jgi:uncharacterized protein HemY
LGLLLSKQKKFDEAASALENARKLTPNDPTTLELLTMTYFKMSAAEKVGEVLSHLQRVDADKAANVARKVQAV